MKITLCGSIAFYDEMLEIKNKLESLGHTIELPPTKVKDKQGNMIPVKQYYELRKKETDPKSWVWDRKEEAMRNHSKKIEQSDAILVVNHDKNNIKGYVGANTLMEMTLCFHFDKKMFLLNQIPDMSYTEEILGMKPLIINGDLSKIR